MSELVEEPKPADERPLERRWIAASLLLHACLIAALIVWWRPRALPEAPPPTIALVFDAPGAAGASAGGGGDTANGTASASPGTDSQAPQPAAQAAPAEAEAPTPPAPSPPEIISPFVAPPAPPTPEPALALAETNAPPPPHPPLKPKAQPRASPAPESVAAPPAVPAPAPQPAPAPAEVATAVAAPPGAGSGPGSAAGQGHGVEGSGPGVEGNGQGPGDDYLDALRRWIAKYKRYPPDALAKNQEGKLVIRFVLARDGTVLDAGIVESSGVPALDQDAVAMLHRASPVPPVPARYAGAQLKITMPLDYKIGFFDRMFK
jgi:periplasmic protein TonB